MRVIFLFTNLRRPLKGVIYALISVATLISSDAFSRHDGPMRFSLFLPCRGTASFCGIKILAEGRIERESGKRLQDFLNKNKSELPPTTELVFDSAGGSVYGAMEMGVVIRRNRLNTQLSAGYSHEVEFNVVDIVKNAQ